MKPKLYYIGEGSDGCGWGVCNTNLFRALGEFFDVRKRKPSQTKFDAPIFVPIIDHRLKYHEHPAMSLEAPAIFGYCFTEAPLAGEAKRNARQYAHIFTGSDWNTKRLTDAEILNCSTLVQGVDMDVFKPQPWADDLQGFRVFSGGKLEFRKGQDYVVAAMRAFMGERKDAVLVTAWHNPWPETAKTMGKSWLLDWARWKEELYGRVVELPGLPNAAMPDVYAQTHVGVFPNRCEAGTNLVMMEYMACGRPVIATDATGHKDVLQGDGPWRLTTGDIDPAGWFNPSVSDIIVALEEAYQDRQALKERGAKCREAISSWPWRRAAQTVFAQVQRHYPQPAS